MTQSTTTDSDANRILSKIKPYAFGVSAVVALLLTIWLPALLATALSPSVELWGYPGGRYVEIFLQFAQTDLFMALWTIGALTQVPPQMDVDDILREHQDLVWTVAAGAGMLLLFTVGFQLVDTVIDAMLGTLWKDSLGKALLQSFQIDSDRLALIAFGVAMVASLKRGHTPAGHRDVYVFTYLTVAATTLLENATLLLTQLLYGTPPEGVGAALEIFTSDLITTAPLGAVLMGTFGIIFAYGIERYGVDVPEWTHDQPTVADGGEK